jgi:HPt (histidine-containing phosphotransfer) domain-containing protein
MIYKSKSHEVSYFGSTELKKETFRKILPYFFQELEEDLILIKQAQQEKKTQAIRLIAHKIKGTSINYSAIFINEKAINIIEQIDKENLGNLQNLIAELEAAIHQSQHFALDKFDFTY